MLHVKDLRVNFGSVELLKGISTDLNPGEVLVITGPNGSGKSTLLSCIAGEIEPAAGTINLSKGTTPAFLKQETPAFQGSAMEFLLSVTPPIYTAYMKMNASSQDTAEFADSVSLFADSGGYELTSELEQIASYFGHEDLERRLSTFSEGEKRILALIRLLASKAELLLLDEPLNHLDISMRVFTEQFVLAEKKKGRCFVIVTHDRVFSDRVADRTLYLQRGEGITVNGGISQMLAHLELELEAKKKHAADLERRISRLEAEVVQRKTWAGRKEHSARKERKLYDGAFLASRAARMAKRSKAAAARRERALKELSGEKPFVEKKIHLSFEDYEVNNRLVVTAEGISKGFKKGPVILNLGLRVTTRDRIAIIGQNGSGKTTIMRTLLADIHPDAGKVHLSKHVNFSYLPQNIEAYFRRQTLLDNLTREGIEASKIRQYLGAARLGSEKALRPVSTLSRGELMRAAIVGAILDKAEFLFLDEPTNHLDIESLTVLDSLLDSFPGGMLFISHDRSFIARHASTIFLLENKTLKPYYF
ncbi:ABC-F family ATP-binding cassette domain-containing protein [candidate division WOR-3 bacterium]|nr:ABC-F family ATP-binding cassette domain-containing protein [candidate division WOR-3 bacterium]